MDMHNQIHPISPGVVTVTDGTAVASGVVNRAGYEGLEFLIAAGTLADVDATFAVLVEHDDVVGFGSASAVADADLLGTEALAALTFADDGEPRKIGYKGTKQFVKCTVTPTSNTGSAPIAIIPVLFGPRKGPPANPPI